MKARGLKAQLATLRSERVTSASFHPDGTLASVAFEAERAPALPPAKVAAERAAVRQADQQQRAAVAADLGVDPAALAAVLGQVPELGEAVS